MAEAAQGAIGAASIEDLVSILQAPRVVWVMVPAGDPTEETLRGLAALMAPGDVLIDGGNSNFNDSKRRAAELAERGIGFVDAEVRDTVELGALDPDHVVTPGIFVKRIVKH